MRDWYFSWPAAIFMIVLASWFLYRFAAPKRWRDWSRAGLVQAFIIALYAEMFGFPLTLYILTRVFRLEVPWIDPRKPLYATLLGLDAAETQRVMLVMMVIGWTFVLIGIGMLIKGWTEIYLASRHKRLHTSGIYGVVRHPQYTGIFLALFGEGVVHWPTVLSLILFPVIVVAYVWLARKEEAEMLRRYGAEYEEYRLRVPMFFPRWRDLGRLFGAASSAAEPAECGDTDAERRVA